jgi:hypothetical protein
MYSNITGFTAGGQKTSQKTAQKRHSLISFQERSTKEKKRVIATEDVYIIDEHTACMHASVKFWPKQVLSHSIENVFRPSLA